MDKTFLSQIPEYKKEPADQVQQPAPTFLNLSMFKI